MTNSLLNPAIRSENVSRRDFSSEKANLLEDQDINSIKAAISSLKPYFTKQRKVEASVVQIQEVFRSGESGYRNALTLRGLLEYIHEQVNALENATTRENSTKASTLTRRSGTRELRLQDLRHIQDQFSIHEEPTLIIRRHSVVLSLNPIRAIVTCEKLIVIVPDGADSLLLLLHDHLLSMVDGKNKDDSFSNEYVFYQAVFSTLVALQTQEYLNASNSFEGVMRDFRSSATVTLGVQDKLRTLKMNISSKVIKINSYKRLFQDLLQKDDSLALMNLSTFRDNPALYE